MSHRFSGRVAIVTGGASGIGLAIAGRLGREGGVVLVADLNETGGRAAAASIAETGAAFIRTDVSKAADCEAMVEEALRRWGRIDILINSAGVGQSSPVAEMPEEMWDAVVDVNLKGVYLCCKAALPRLGPQGVIVSLASLAGLKAAPGMGAYAASKAGVVHLTHVMALEAAPRGIRVNALCPVWIDTPMVQNYAARSGDSAAVLRALAATIPLGRLGTVDDVAAAALFLASDEASFITGVALPVDGGALCR